MAALQGGVECSDVASPAEVQSQSIPILDFSDHSTTSSVRASPRTTIAVLQRGVATRDLAVPEQIESQSRPILDVSDPSTPSTDSGASIRPIPRATVFLLPSSSGSSQPSSATPGTPARLAYASNRLRNQSLLRREVTRRLSLQFGEIDIPTATPTPSQPASRALSASRTPTPVIVDGRTPAQQQGNTLPAISPWTPARNGNPAPTCRTPTRGRSAIPRPNGIVPIVVRPTPALVPGQLALQEAPPHTAERERRRDEHVRLFDHGLSSGEGSEHAIASDDEYELSQRSSEPESSLQGIVGGRPRNAAWGQHPVAPNEESVVEEFEASSSEGENP